LIYAKAAGRIGVTGTGVQLMNINILKTSSHTATKANTIVDKGTTILKVPNTDGLFPGLAISGTGIGASAVISTINPDNTIVSSVASTVSGVISSVYTFNDSTIYWHVCYFNNPFSIT
jgi:hypothetical protein